MEARKRASKKYYEKNKEELKRKRRERYARQKERTFTCQECGLRYENDQEQFMCELCEETEALLNSPAQAQPEAGGPGVPG